MTANPSLRNEPETVTAADAAPTDVLTSPKSRMSSLRIPEIKATRGVEIKGDLGNLRISPLASDIRRAPGEIRDDEHDMDQDLVLALGSRRPLPVRSPFRKVVTLGAWALSAGWLGFCAFSMIGPQGFSSLPVLTVRDVGGALAAALAPVALLWMIIAHALRGGDIERYAEALREELQSIIFPSGERAQQINQDMERLCQQAAELAMSSKAVIKAISRARQGLRVEIRDFVGMSKKTEFHIDRLADTLTERAARLQALTSEIEQRTAGIGARTQEGVESWGKATATVLERAAEMETSLGQGARRILDAAGEVGVQTKDIGKTLEDSFESLNAVVDRVAQRLDDLSGEFAGHRTGLTEAAETVSAETSRLSSEIGGQIERLEETAREIGDQRRVLDEGAVSLAAQAERVSGAIAGSVGVLKGAADGLTASTEEIEARLDGQAGRLRAAVAGIGAEASAIEDAGTVAANRLGEALSVALSGAEAIGGAVRRAVEQLEKSSETARQQADGLIESASEKIGRLNGLNENNVESMRTILATLEQCRAQIEAASALAGEQASRLTQAVEDQARRIDDSASGMEDRLKSVRGMLEEPLRNVAAAVAEADARHREIEETLRRRVTDLNEATDKAKDGAEHIKSTLRGQAQEISALAGQISGQTREINEQMADQRQNLSMEVREALDGMRRVGEKLDEQAGKLAELSENAVLDVGKSERLIGEKCSEIGESTGRMLAELSRLDESIRDRFGSLKDKADEASDSVRGVMASLDGAVGGFEPVMTRTMEKTVEAKARFDDLRSGFETSSESALERLKQIGIVFDERLTSLRAGAGEARTILDEAAGSIGLRKDEMERAAGAAGNSLRDIGRILEDRSSDVHLLSDQAALKMDGIQKALGSQFHELSESVGQAVVQLESVVAQLGRSTEALDGSSDKAIGRLGEIAKTVREEKDALERSFGTAAQTGEESARLLKDISADLLRASRDTLVEIKKAGDGLTLRAREVSEQMAASLKTSREYGEDLKRQTQLVADGSAASADRVSKAVSTLTARIDDIDAATRAALARIDKSRESLGEESTKLRDISESAIKAAEDAAAGFARQSGALFRAVEEASRHIDKIRTEEWRMQREAFMASAKFVVESLHSLSVDFSRTLEGDIPEKTWKAFQKGDIGAFTRRLSQMGLNMPVDRIRDKFAEDNEFRTYVQRFIRQFEDVYGQAVENDHGDLLGATFASSDVGRLYALLCGATGREPRFARTDRKAA